MILLSNVKLFINMQICTVVVIILLYLTVNISKMVVM
ncbi:MAG TPA: hypothetical protein [Caudoviricetes sp.]|nr:MAG TPA: hypothetical protein [Caudoviricetes sp.]